MDRNYYHYNQPPICPNNIALVDQYLWPQKNTTRYRCINGPSTPIYNCQGNIAHQLPLHMYPKNNGMVANQVTKDQSFPIGLTRLGVHNLEANKKAVVQDRRLNGFYNIDSWEYKL